MEFVYSKAPPIMPDSSFAEAFIDYMGDSNYIQLATGYISEDSILFLKENIESHDQMKCDLFIGMHLYDGFTKSQYDAAKDLGIYLLEKKRGSVLACKAFPYHGKFYNFINHTKHFASITGSANLTQIIPSRQRNITIKISEKTSLAELNSYFEYLKQFCVPIQEYVPTKFKGSNTLLKDCIGVTKLSTDDIVDTFKKRQKTSFKLLLKPEKKSNLNIFFGKGRLNTRKGIIRPRSWFEFEVIVSKHITTQKEYPHDRSFNVITDDGWMFECRTQGDYSKNFRSTGGLATLGMWVKGKLLDAGVVKAGEFVTPEMLKQYGSDSLVLTATENPDVWLLEYRGA